MAIEWGSWGAYTRPNEPNNRMRLGLDISRSGGTVTVEYWLQTKGAVYYNGVTLTRTGSISGGASVNVSIAGGSATQRLRTDTVSITRGQTRTFGASMGLPTGSGSMTGSVSGKSITWPAGVPSTPGTPTAGTVTATTAPITWSHPANNGSTLLEYQVQRATNSGFTSGTVSFSGITGTSFTVTGLTRATNYWIRIRVRNAVGWSSWSGGRAVTTLALAPSTPGTPTAGTITSTSAAVSWSAPNNGGSAITEYQVQRATNSGFTTGTVNFTGITGTSRTVTGLTFNTDYWIRVRAKNAIGWSGWSSGRKVTTSPGVPTTPSAPTVSVTSSTAASGTATAPANNGSAITGYDWQVSTSTAFSSITRSGSTTGLSWSATSLSPNTTYYMRVRAKNAAGLSEWSGSRSFTTAVSTPAATSIPNVSRTSDTSHTITWVNNSTGSAPYTNVEVYRKSNVYPDWVRIANLSGTATSFTDTATVANREFQWRTRAVNAAGGATRDSEIRYTTPTSPTGATATRVSNNIRVSWNNNAAYAHTVAIQVAINGVWQSGDLATVSSTLSSYTHANPDQSNNYRYRVIARSTSPVLNSAASTTGIVQLETPPNAPTIGGPEGTLRIDQPAYLTWVHNPVDSSEQRQYRIRHRRLGTSTWTTLSITASTNEFYNLPLSSYSNNDTVEWQVMTWGSHATGSPWSESGQFDVASIPVTGIISPPATLNEPFSPIQWTFSDASGGTQVSYEYQIEQEGTVVASGTHQGSNTTQNVSLTFRDNTAYIVRVRVTSSTGLVSGWATRSVVVSYPLPAAPQVTAEWDAEAGAANVTVYNPAVTLTPVTNEITNPKPAIRPTDTQEILARNEAWNPSFERSSGETVLLTNHAPNPSFEAAGSVGVVWRNRAPYPIAAPGAAWWVNYGSVGVGSFETIDHGRPMARISWDTAPTGGTPRITATNQLYTRPGVTPGETLTISMDVASSGPPVGLLLQWQDASGIGIGATVTMDRVPVSSNPGSPTRLTLTTTTAPAGAEIAAIWATVHPSDVNDGDWLAAGSLMVGGGPYFDGSYSPDPDLTARWTGTANASTSELVGVGVPGMGSSQPNVSRIRSGEWSSDRAYSMRLIPTTDSNDSFTHSQDIRSFASGRWVVARAKYRLPSPLAGTLNAGPLMLSVLSNQGGWASQSEYAPNTAGTHVLTTEPLFVESGSTSAFVRFRNGASVGNGDLWIDDFVILTADTEAELNGKIALLESLADGYFDGSTTTDSDLTAGWVDVPDNSTSEIIGTALPVARGLGTSVVNCARIQSSQWSSDRGHSMRLIPTTENTDSYTNGSQLAAIFADKWVSVRAKYHLPKPLTGTLDSFALMLAVINDAGSNSVAYAPNQAGTHVLTTPPLHVVGSSVFPRFRNGASVGNGDLYIDDYVLLAGDTEADVLAQIAVLDAVGGYFDGESTTSGYSTNGLYQVRPDGVVDNSATTLYRDVNTQWGLSEPEHSSVSYATDDLGATVWEFRKEAGTASAMFTLPSVSASGEYMMFSADVHVVSGGNGTRTSVSMLGTNSSSETVELNEQRRVTRQGYSTGPDVTPAITVRGLAAAVVRVKRLTLVRGSDEDRLNTVYFDGDSSGSGWNGTPNDSTSTLTTRERFNAISNSGFESGTTTWTVSNLTQTLNTNGSYVASGVQSLRLQPATSPNMSNPGVLTSTARAIDVRQAVAAGILVINSTTTPISARVGAQFRSGTTTLATSWSEWTEVSQGHIGGDSSLIHAPAMACPVGADTVRLVLETDRATNLSLYVDDARMMIAPDVTTASEWLWRYFDSTFGSYINEYGYTTSYSVSGNRQRELWGDTQSAVYNIIYRKIEDGPWEEVATNVPLNGSITDPLAAVGTTVRYMASAVTALPSLSESNDAILYFPGDECTIVGAYLSGGPEFATIAGLRYNLNVVESAGRPHKELYWFATRRTPVEITTPAVTRAVNVRGTIVIAEDAAGGVFRNIREWRELATLPAPLLYRDDMGRYIKGSISNFTINESTAATIEVSFTITEAENG